MSKAINIASDFSLTLNRDDLACIAWARNLTALALHHGHKQDRAKPASVASMLGIVDLTVKKINQDEPLDGQLMRGFVMAGWGLLDLAEHWLTVPALMAETQRVYGWEAFTEARRAALAERLGRIVDDLKLSKARA